MINQKEKIFKLIDDKKEAMISYSIKNSKDHIELVSTDIAMLQNYIDGKIFLSLNEIDTAVSC